MNPLPKLLGIDLPQEYRDERYELVGGVSPRIFCRAAQRRNILQEWLDAFS